MNSMPMPAELKDSASNLSDFPSDAGSSQATWTSKLYEEINSLLGLKKQ